MTELVELTYDVGCDHSDWNPFNAHGWKTDGPFTRWLTVSPGHAQERFKYTYEYAGGGYFHEDYDVAVNLTPQGEVSLSVVGTMTDDGSNVQLDQASLTDRGIPVNPLPLSAGQTSSAQVVLGYGDVASVGYQDGPSRFTITAKRSRGVTVDQLYAWGANDSGQLGNGSWADTATPTPVARLGDEELIVSDVAAGALHTLAIRYPSRLLYAWGYNGSGQLGDGTSTARPTPVLVTVPFAFFRVPFIATAIATGWYHSLAIGSPLVSPSSHELWAWGYNTFGQVGNGNRGTMERTPSPVRLSSGHHFVAAVAPGVHPIAAGGCHSLAIRSADGLEDGQPYAWGYNHFGQLGDGTNVDKPTPTLIPIETRGDVPFRVVAAGMYHSLAIGTDDGRLYAWGYNGYGQLGDGTTTDRWSPTAITRNGSPFLVTAVAAGAYHNLAIGVDGQLYAWGRNFGQLGDGTTTNSWRPKVISLNGDTPRFIAAGLYHSLAIGASGQLYAWGINSDGQLGDGTQVAKLRPERTGYRSLYIVAGAAHSVSISDG